MTNDKFKKAIELKERIKVIHQWGIDLMNAKSKLPSCTTCPGIGRPEAEIQCIINNMDTEVQRLEGEFEKL